MHGIENFWLFVTAGFLLNITPGPDMLYVVTRSATQGRAAGTVSALGIFCGCLVHIAAAAFGLSALLMTSALAFEIVKWCGAIYLIYLGVRSWLGAGRTATTSPDLGQASLSAIFRQGFVVNVLNPKVALFFLTFLPQFTDPAAGNLASQILLLGLTFDTMGTGVLLVVAVCAATLRPWLRTASALPARVSGAIFILLGIGLAVSRRRL